MKKDRAIIEEKIKLRMKQRKPSRILVRLKKGKHPYNINKLYKPLSRRRVMRLEVF